MPTKAANPASVQTIKWTEEEWKKIATKLYAINGPEVLLPGNLEQIKARDIFDAQAAVLPENRHRKLISLAQGFQAIRNRLGVLIAEVAEEAPMDKPAVELDTESKLARKGSRPGKQADAGQRALFSPDAGIAAETNGAVESPGKQAGEETATDEPVERQAQPWTEPVTPQLSTKHEDAFPANSLEPASAEPFASLPAGQPRPDKQVVPVRVNKESPADAEYAAGSGALDTSSVFIEQIRPFVSMVCEELARALVKTMAESGMEGGLPALMQGVLKQSAAAQAGAGLRDGRQFTQRQEADDQGMADEDAFHEPQPLFDPKLPPSANSEFKPTIGLVGASEYQTIDLQVLYPQLQLVSVPADAVKIGRPFQRCQRVIGIQEEVPAPVNEFLGRILRHRYVRVSGGMEQVQEQLNSWLSGSGALTMKPGKTGPRDGKGTRNIYAKKRPNRYRP